MAHKYFEKMSDQKASLVFIGLAKSLRFFKEHPLIQFGGAADWPLRTFLDRGFDGLGHLVDDPVVASFLRFMQVQDDSVVSLGSAISKLSQKTTSGYWVYLQNQQQGGVLDVIEKIRTFGPDSLMLFIESVCSSGFKDPYHTAIKNVNYVGGEISETLYSVKLYYNIINEYLPQYNLTVTADDWAEDVLLSFSMKELHLNVHQAIQAEMDSFQAIYDKLLGQNLLGAVYFTGVAIQANGVDLVRIPLRFDGDEKALDSMNFKFADRIALNANGSSAYRLDYGQIEVISGSAQELKELATLVPREAVHRLKGAALSDSLGL